MNQHKKREKEFDFYLHGGRIIHYIEVQRNQNLFKKVDGTNFFLRLMLYSRYFFKESMVVVVRLLCMNSAWPALNCVVAKASLPDDESAGTVKILEHSGEDEIDELGGGFFENDETLDRPI